MAWFRRSLTALRDRDVLFFDPDNGLTEDPTERATTISPKHAILAEVSAAWNSGHSLVIYHHIGRHGTAGDQVARWLGHLETVVSDAQADAILFRRGSCRAYLILSQLKHHDRLQVQVEALLRSPWRRHFEAVRG